MIWAPSPTRRRRFANRSRSSPRRCQETLGALRSSNRVRDRADAGAAGAAPRGARLRSRAGGAAAVPHADRGADPQPDPPLHAPDDARLQAPQGAREAARTGLEGPQDAASPTSTRCSTNWPSTRPGAPTRATCSGPRGSTTTRARCSSSRTRMGPLRRGARARVLPDGAGSRRRPSLPRPSCKTLLDLTRPPSVAQLCG